MEQIAAYGAPRLVLMDINMPKMDGYETTIWLRQNHPDVLVLALSMYDDESSIIRMIRSGARGYILKDSHPNELRQALHTILEKGFYHSELVSGSLIKVLNHLDNVEHAGIKEAFGLSDKQIDFLRFVCTDLSYKEISEKMNVSARTIDGYRDELLDRLNCKSRIGLVIFAIRHGIFRI
jgi:DNA-binding NarL/FixJ family response regulator